MQAPSQFGGFRGFCWAWFAILFWISGWGRVHSAEELVRLAWDPSPDRDVTGYVIVYGFESGRYVFTNDAGRALQAVVMLLVPDERYYFAAQARNAAGIYSEPSNEVTYQAGADPTNPSVIRLAMETVENTPAKKDFSLPATDPAKVRLLFKANPSHGSLTVTATNLIYVPQSNYTGADSFRLIYGVGNRGAVKVEVTVNVAVDHAPVAYDQVVPVTPGKPAQMTVRASDADNPTLIYALISAPRHGDLQGHLPNVVYLPSPGFEGTDEFTFLVGDGLLVSGVARVELDVVNQRPVVQDTNLTTRSGESVVIDLTAEDPEEGRLRFFIVSLPRFGVLEGTLPNLVYRPAPGFFGIDRFLFAALDDHQQYAVGRATIEVTPGAGVMPEIGASRSENGEIELAWPSMPGMSYHVFYRADLQLGIWTLAAELGEATGPVTRWRTRIDPAAGTAFFQLQIAGPEL